VKRHLNTLFVTTQDAWLVKEGEAVVVRVDREDRLRVPIHNLGGIVCFGRIGMTPPLMAHCAENGTAISFLTEDGRFLARVSGFTPGNVLLRREQYRRADDPAFCAAVSRNIVSAKIANSRNVLARSLRDHPDPATRSAVEAAVVNLASSLDSLDRCRETDRIRGIEGEAAATYFGVFDSLIVCQKEDFRFNTRSRRPPLDNVNALLSFLYGMLGHDLRSACEAAGLDPAVGFLHRDRPGRPGLALDLMEEFRAFLADRLALSLINRRQVDARGFERSESGAVTLTKDARKSVLEAYQRRKQDEFVHPYLDERVTVGLLPHLQARLLARFLRGELDAYPAFLWK